MRDTARTFARKKALNAALYAERLTRVECHKAHTVFLIANAAIRNRWLNDKLLHVGWFRDHENFTNIDIWISTGSVDVLDPTELAKRFP